MKLRRYSFITLVLSLLISMFSFASGSFTYAAAGDDPKYTFTHTTTEIGGGTSTPNTIENFYMDDIEGGFGELTKTFSYPSSFSVSATLKENIVKEAIQEIIEYTNVSISSLGAALAIDVEGISREYETFQFEPNDYPDNIDLNSNIGSRVIESEGEFDITGRYCFTIGYFESVVHFITVNIYFNMDSLHMSPIVDGSLIYLQTTNDNSENISTSTSASILSIGGVFSTDPNSTGYIVSSLDSIGLPSNEDEYDVTFYYGNMAAITGKEYSSNYNPVREEPYEITASIRFKTTDGEWHTLRTNTITIRSHNLRMRINGIEDYRVAINKEYEYSFIFDGGDIENAVLDDYYGLSFGGTQAFMDNEGKLKYTFDELGTKTVKFSYMFVYFNDYHEVVIFEDLSFDVEVLSEEPEIIPPDYHIDFSFDSDDAVLFGGSQFTISASINEFYGDEHFETEISISGTSLGVLESTSSTLTLIPLSVGLSVIQFKAVSRTAGEYNETAFLEVVQSTAANTTIEFVDEINLTGSDVTAYLKVGEYSSFINANPKWSVQVESGENLVDVEFTTDELGRAVMKESRSGFYHYNVNGEGIYQVETVRRVSDIDMAQLAESLLPYIAPIMVLLVIIILIIRKWYKSRHTLYRRLNNISKFLESFIKDLSTRTYKRNMRKLIRKIKKCQSTAYLRDQATLGQYQTICNTLSNCLKMCQVMSKDIKKKDLKKFLVALKEHFIDVAANTCLELDKALEKFAKQKVVVETKKPKETKEEKLKNTKNMQKKFFRQADHEDDNGRFGDSDRNADTKTEG